METREKPPAKQIVHAPSRGLAVRSAAIVARGLRDLTRNSNWLVQRVFTGHSPYLGVSPAGQVCAVVSGGRQGAERLALFDIERGSGSVMLAVPRESPARLPEAPALFAYSPTGRYLVAAWGGWPAGLHSFDLSSEVCLGAFGDFFSFPSALAWSDDGKYFASASARRREAVLRLWTAGPESHHERPFTGEPAAQLALADLAALFQRPETAASGGISGDEVAVAGFGRLAFRPAGEMLAAAVEVEGEWADDAIVFLENPTLATRDTFLVQGHVTDMSWSYDGTQLIFCSAGQAYRLLDGAREPVALPFGAELCACHPHLPLCLCFSSWLKNSAKGRVFLADLNRLTVLDEHTASGIADLRWSLDGTKAYAVTSDGLAYIYEPPIL
jgi:WD40 repeat protein